MPEIATGAAARDAWNALPDSVRAEAAHLAEQGKPHPDPAVSAIIIGALRHETRAQRWGGRLFFIVLITLVGGLWLGLLMLGGEIEDVGWSDAPIDLALAGALLVIVGSAGLVHRLDRRRLPAPPPSAAQTPNLRALLLLPRSLTTPRPMTIRRHHPFLPIVLAALPFATAYGYLLACWTGRPLDLRGGLHHLAELLVASTLATVIARYTRRAERKLRREAPMPIRLTDAGLRFGFGLTIPWPDVLGVYITADTLEWALRDRPHRVMEFGATATHPEDIVLAARAYAAHVSPEQRVAW
jgi:hypothetical protein